MAVSCARQRTAYCSPCMQGFRWVEPRLAPGRGWNTGYPNFWNPDSTYTIASANFCSVNVAHFGFLKKISIYNKNCFLCTFNCKPPPSTTTNFQILFFVEKYITHRTSRKKKHGFGNAM